ncbi:hypothetical protein EVJ58_g10841 [Rhodofomes roseus]|uniref:Uncharacterized protein n=1 Tax=Rhodofomes roseus TaxID=34475 RepID=A0A4Y9XNF6_9APHY|nr:hypothetical protein EVJ58_g10841 [Rhodofomes roseus]
MSQSYPPGQTARDLLYLFPHVEDDTMSSILNHSLPGGDLYKLDSRRILEAQWDLIDASLDDSASPHALRSAPARRRRLPHARRAARPAQRVLLRAHPARARARPADDAPLLLLPLQQPPRQDRDAVRVARRAPVPPRVLRAAV